MPSLQSYLRFLLKQPVPIEVDGWQSNMHALQDAGWETESFLSPINDSGILILSKKNLRIKVQISYLEFAGLSNYVHLSKSFMSHVLKGNFVDPETPLVTPANVSAVLDQILEAQRPRQEEIAKRKVLHESQTKKAEVEACRVLALQAPQAPSSQEDEGGEDFARAAGGAEGKG